MGQQEFDTGTLDPAAMENLREMVGGDEEFVVELINTFLQDAPQMLEDMRQAMEEQDAELLRRAAHSLKSNSAEFGAVFLSDLCREIERMGKEGSLDEAREPVTRAQTEFAKVKPLLEAMC